MKKTILFDLDGTLADIKHRRHLVEGSKKNWDEFFQRINDDSPNQAILELYKTLYQSANYNLILITGRPEKYRVITEQWLFSNDIPFQKLIMRQNNDQRQDSFIKEDILNNLRLEHDILFVVDDRQQVVDMWRRNGITCLQCDVGNF